MSFLNDLFIWISFEILMFKGAFRKSCSATSMFMLLAWHSINGWDQRPDRIPCYHYHPLSRFTPTLSISSSSWDISHSGMARWVKRWPTFTIWPDEREEKNEKWWCFSNLKYATYFSFNHFFVTLFNAYQWDKMINQNKTLTFLISKGEMQLA